MYLRLLHFDTWALFVNGLMHARQLLCFLLVECNGRLKSAQQKVEKLIEDNGELKVEQFEPENMQGESK
jgi:hypothetical protein